MFDDPARVGDAMPARVHNQSETDTDTNVANQGEGHQYPDRVIDQPVRILCRLAVILLRGGPTRDPL